MMAGAFVSLGGTLSVLGAYGLPEFLSSVSIVKIVAGSLFPVGLILVVMLGAELFTGNNAMLIPGYIKKHYKISDVMLNWALVYFGNFIGVLIFTVLFVWDCSLFSSPVYHSAIDSIVRAKVDQEWLMVFLKGIGANWCVCLALWLALSADSLTGKVLGSWIPVMTFVVLGYEHSIANMFYFTSAQLEGTSATIGECLWGNLFPATIGNIIGGAVFVGCLHTWVHSADKK